MWPFKNKTKIAEGITTNAVVYTQEMKQADGYLGVLLNAAQTIRSRFSGGTFGISPDGKRNYNELYGYGEQLAYIDYFGMYKRGGIAHAVVTKLPKACWRELPKIKSGDTEILKDEMKVLKNMGFFRALERADILNRIGNFSVLLIGVPDATELKLPVGSANSFDGMYFNPYSFDGIEIVKVDTDPASPRFGLPILYQVRTTNLDRSKRKEQIFVTHIVHYTRIIHMAEGALDSSIEGSSSLEPVWNALIDKNKVRGGAAEAHFRNARQKLALETLDGATVNADPDSPANVALKENVLRFQNDQEDVLRLNKMKANMLQPSLVSPRDSNDIAVEDISGTTGIPIRILTGKGGGQTTGTEDKAAWNALVFDREEQECSLWLIQGLSIMAEAGLLKLPDNVEVEWSPQKSLNEKESTESNKNKATTLKTVVEAITAAQDDIDIQSVLDAVGLDDIKATSINAGDNDNALDESLK